MKHRLLALVVPMLLALPLAPAQAATATSVTAKVSSTSVVAGKTVTISGTASGPRGRRVVLQLKTGTGWVKVASGVTGPDRRYRLRVPTHWYNRHALRVVAPAAGRSATGISVSRGVQVKPSYVAAGSVTDWGSLGGSNARWNPCRPITWKFNQNGGYPGSLSDLKSAFTRISRATGIRFSYQGTTNDVAFSGGFDPSAAVIVTFVSSLAGSAAGKGGAWYVESPGRPPEFVRGELALDRSESALRPGFASSGNPTWGQVMMHELGHVIGLDHADSPTQLMYGTLSSSNHRLGAGDLNGFNRLGMRRGCIADSARDV